MSNTALRGVPRSVADPDADSYDAMIRKHRELMQAREAADGGPRGAHGHETPLQSAGMSPKVTAAAKPGTPAAANPASFAGPFDFARRGRAEWEAGHPIKGMADALSGAADLYLAGSAVRGLAQGAFKLRGPFVWRTKPWEEARGARNWMGDKGFLEKGEVGHHGLVPNNQWGRSVPDWIKNQPWNIKGIKSPETHGRIHGRYKGQPQFNPLERFLQGTPDWWKAAVASATGHGVSSADDARTPK